MLKYKIEILPYLKNEKGITTYDIKTRGILSGSALAKLCHGDMIGINVLNDICRLTGLQPGDLIEYVPDEKK